MRRLFLFLLGFLTMGIALRADFAASLQWVKTFGGSGKTNVIAAATDTQGNLYIVGNTTSIDLPVTIGPGPGGSPLVRISSASGAAQKLYPPGLSSIGGIT